MTYGPTQRERVLQMLEEAGEQGVTNGDFCAAFLPNFQRRILELRREGYDIPPAEYVRQGSTRYRLEGTSESGEAQPNMHPAVRQDDGASPNETPVTPSPDCAALFEMPARGKTRSAVTGNEMDAA